MPPTKDAHGVVPAGAPVSGGVLERIRALMPQMPEVQRMLAGIVAADPAAASRMTIVELAELGQVSTGSITRLCRALGLSGYSELRLALASDSARTEPYSLAAHIGADVAPGDDIQQIAKVILANVSRAVTDSVNHVNLLDIERAAAKLTAARRVEIFGVGGSGVMAADLQQRLYRIGIPCWAWSDTHVALTGAALLGANDVVVVISHSGRTREVHDLVTEAASHGAFTIAVTDERRSPAAGNADLVLSTSVGDLGYRTEAIVARHAQLAVLDLLYVAMAQRTFEQTRDAIAVTAHAVSAYKEKPRKK